MKATEALEIINGFCLARTTLKMSLEERDREQTKVLESYAKEHAIEFAEYLRMPKDVAKGEYEGWIKDN